MLVQITNAGHDEERTLRVGMNHVARYAMVGRDMLILLESWVYISFLTGVLDYLDNIMRDIVRFVGATPCDALDTAT